MNKQEFLNALREALCGMPRADREERLAFYRSLTLISNSLDAVCKFSEKERL